MSGKWKLLLILIAIAVLFVVVIAFRLGKDDDATISRWSEAIEARISRAPEVSKSDRLVEVGCGIADPLQLDPTRKCTIDVFEADAPVRDLPLKLTAGETVQIHFEPRGKESFVMDVKLEPGKPRVLQVPKKGARLTLTCLAFPGQRCGVAFSR